MKQVGSKIDGSTKTSEVLKIEKVEGEEEILGRKCHKLIIYTDKGNTTYWYDPKIKVNMDNFQNHNFGNWNKYLEATDGALPLKFMVLAKNYIWEATATEIKEMELKEKEFILPKTVKIK